MAYIYNNEDKAKTLQTTPRFNERMAGFTGAVNIASGEPLSSIKSIDVPANTALVLELKK